jgi:CubicO group peptidase (beta-lactamase class C family)
MLLCQCAFAETQFSSAEFKKFVDSELHKWQVPGCAVLIIQDNKVILKEGYGFRDLKNKLPVTPKTIFAIGSCTKAFTAFSAGLLVDEKKLDFDKPVRNYYPELQLYDPYITWTVTPRDLLCHRTGIPGYDSLWYHSKFTRQQLMDRLRYLKPNKGFRDMFQYNNLMFVLAGEVVAKVSGMSWDDFVKNRIFIPLDMRSTNTSISETQKSGDYSKPYFAGAPILKNNPEKTYFKPAVEVPAYNITSVGPAGSINSNLEDLEKWVRLYLNHGKIGNKQFISRETLEQLVYPQIPAGRNFSGRLDIMSPSSYCLGWGSNTYRGNYTITHSGSIDGFTSLICVIPGKKIAVVILTNTFKNDFSNIIGYYALDLALGHKPAKWSDMYRKAQLTRAMETRKAQQRAEAARKKGTIPSHQLVDYAGKFIHPAFGDCIIVEKDGKLNMDAEGTLIPLEHYQYDTFAIKGANLPLTFGMNNSGDITTVSMSVEAGTDPIVFEKEVK